MYIIIGLGNPGKKYEHTRHNAGFDAIDKLAEKYNIKMDKLKHKALIGEGRIGTEKVVLVKPQTYMNLSGESIVSICQFYKPEFDKVIVMYDDIDLDVGKLRIRKKGSAGSHNGMKSIIKCIGTQEFPRIRIGVSKPPEGWDLADFVLSRFPKEQQGDLEESFERAVLTVEEIIDSGIESAMNKYNG
ncbi:aminoacyl-tRNA hydrolase [Peptostreptococcus russellii]|uniref:Peptidyl-tRNA hydrolase n=1 Tax=Peptostreptococcus russellii TaxID=215200 RepID=A0A1H8G0U2_9FIRM|nr:aminoacyl-tRNA hydrolase [Peptostreptococcus russellii]MBC2578127.1 aminoacyl-tRNA hydrolase [Peptostreptococcus russellii]SEN37404.1 peptidyl-tRNA hydrolase [Peptostreptococcus russellii]